jgi:hypothetical protein
MIRCFPPRFDNPLPKEWPNNADEWGTEVYPWILEKELIGSGRDPAEMYECSPEGYRAKWRGFRAMMRALVEYGEGHNITELRFGSKEVMSGINCHIFDQKCQEYDALVVLLKRPGFRRLDLDLFTGDDEYNDHNLNSYRSGLLREALAQAKYLRHISLRCTAGIKNKTVVRHSDWDEFSEEAFPLDTIFPIDHWPNLQHFGISNMFVKQSNLISVLAALPKSLRSVELSHLGFDGKHDSYWGLLNEMRTKLDWCSRPAGQSPKVHIVVSTSDTPARIGFYVEVDDAVNSFLYGDGSNPFRKPGDKVKYTGTYACGIRREQIGVERDFFEPSFSAPFEFR